VPAPALRRDDDRARLPDRAATGNPWRIGGALGAGYGFAWAGHFFVEHDRPATFGRPLGSLAGDRAMFSDILTRRIPFALPVTYPNGVS
jgi:hypothetical protein